MGSWVIHVFLLLAAGLFMPACTQNQPTQKPHQALPVVPVAGNLAVDSMAVATFASGCFWCSEGVFEQVRGVEKVVSGYSGGEERNPTYQQVSKGATGHAEAIQIYYNPSQISYPELLEIFFGSHDPTTLNRQGPDVGKHYRSAIFYRNNKEQEQAKNYILQLNKSGEYSKPIVTEVVPFKAFWEAEQYHQDYYLENSNDPYMRSVFQPKLKKVKENFGDKIKEK